MKTCGTQMFVLAALLLLLVAVPTQAEEDYDDRGGDGVPNYALGLGFGLVDPDADVEPYYTAGLRIRLGRDHDRASRGGIRGYLEPEVAYWSNETTSDLLLGVNLLGLVPFQQVDYYFGVGVGYHFYDVDDVLDVNTGQLRDESDERLGMNAQFGIDVKMSDNVAVFGTARFDLIEDSDDEVQDKVFIGLRFNL